MVLKPNSKIDAFKLVETVPVMKVSVFLDLQCKNFISLIENLILSKMQLKPQIDLCFVDIR